MLARREGRKDAVNASRENIAMQRQRVPMNDYTCAPPSAVPPRPWKKTARNPFGKIDMHTHTTCTHVAHAEHKVCNDDVYVDKFEKGLLLAFIVKRGYLPLRALCAVSVL